MPPKPEKTQPPRQAPTPPTEPGVESGGQADLARLISESENPPRAIAAALSGLPRLERSVGNLDQRTSDLAEAVKGLRGDVRATDKSLKELLSGDIRPILAAHRALLQARARAWEALAKFLSSEMTQHLLRGAMTLLLYAAADALGLPSVVTANLLRALTSAAPSVVAPDGTQVPVQTPAAPPPGSPGPAILVYPEER